MINSGGQAYQAASRYLGSLLSKGLKGSKFNLGAGFKGAGGIEGAAGAAADIIGSLLPQKSEYAGEKGNITAGMDKAYDTISDAVAVIPGLGTAASAIMKGGALLGKGVNALGGGTDGMTTTDAILGSSFLNLTPIGLINGFGGKKAHKITSDMKQRQAFETVGGSYSGSVLNYANASKYSGKKYGAFSRHARKRANRKIDEANRQVSVMKNISQEAQLDFMLGNGMQDINNMKYQMDLQGGYNPYTSIGRRGLRLPTKKELDRSRRISSNIKNKQTIKNKFFIPNDFSYTYQLGDQIEVPEEQVKAFKNGGQMSIIPEGALHARKNNMNVENITKKGIPVVDNEGTQQAEIERNEIIFSKEATTKLEELMNDGSDQAAIEAGKLLVKEITTNLDDKTGLTSEIIQKAQEGGTLKPFIQKGFNKDSIKSYNDLIKYMESTGRQTTDDYDLEKAYNDSDVYNSWIDEETKNPGKGHWPDKYKKPNHMTFSDESIYSNDDQLGGQWLFKNNKDVFVVSPYLTKLHSYDDYVNYFKNNEPNVAFIYNGKSYNLNNLDDKTGLTKEVILKNQNGGNLNQILGGTANPTGSIIQQPTIQIPNTQEIASKMKPITDKINQDNLENFQNKQAQTKSLIGAGFQAAQGIMEGFSQAKQVKQQYNQKVEAEKQKIFSQVGTNKLQFAQEGEKLPERKYKTYKDWVTYLESTGRKTDKDYDNEGFYNDPDTYFVWQEEEEKNPGKAHMSDKYKLPTYMTFSTDSKYSTPDKTGGTWSSDDNGDIFITSPYLESIHSLADYLRWLPINDSGVKTLIYKGKSYHIGRKK